MLACFVVTRCGFNISRFRRYMYASMHALLYVEKTHPREERSPHGHGSATRALP